MELQGLVDRAGELQDRIDGEIAGARGYCKFCSERGRYCDVAGVEAFEDREKLAEIRDLLKDVENMLVHLQRLRSWQLVSRNAALARLEEARVELVQKGKQYRGRSLDVIRELNECFGDGWIGEDKAREDGPARTQKRRAFGFLGSCIGALLNPWKWHQAAGVAARVVLVSVTVSSTVSLAVHGRHQSSVSRRRIVSFMGSKPEMEKGASLDVVYGRG